jgi:hypothetical protein
MATTDGKKRRSRFGGDPILDDAGNEIIIGTYDLTRLQRRVLKACAQRRQNLRYIAAIADSTYSSVREAVDLLKAKGNEYIKVIDEQQNRKKFVNVELYYELTDKGYRAIGAEPVERPVAFNLEHEIMIEQIMTELEIGIRQMPECRFISWQEILRSENLPAKTKQLKSPNAVPVTYDDDDGVEHAVRVIADDMPFGIERTHDGEKSYLFFPGIEADCGNETVEPTKWKKNSIKTKFLGYRAIAGQRIYDKHFGFPNFFGLFITNDANQLRRAKECLYDLTKGKGSAQWGFKLHASLYSDGRAEPTGKMFTEPFERVGYPPLYLWK